MLQRVDIGSHAIRLRLDRASCLRSWRSALPDPEGFADAALLVHFRTFLMAGEELVEVADCLKLTLPVRARFRGGRASMLAPGGSHLCTATNLALIRALARAHRWKRMLLTGEAHSIGDIARRFQLDRSDADRILGLAFLSPRHTHEILSGRQHPGLRLKNLLDISLPLSWREQHTAIERIAAAVSL